MSTALSQPYAVTEEHPEGQATVSQGDWRHEANCRPGMGVDPELFFPVAQVGKLYNQQVREAKKVCFQCPAASDCLNWALATGQTAGVAGGMSEEERRELHLRGYGRKIQ